MFVFLGWGLGISFFVLDCGWQLCAVNPRVGFGQFESPIVSS
jgi:hypothetical protein